GNREFLVAILLSGVFAWVAIVFSYLLEIPLHFRAYEANIWFLAGGFLFGLGTAVNQGCGVSTLNRLSSGESKMVATLVGWFLGWMILTNWHPQIVLIEKPIPETVIYGGLISISVVLSVWVYRGNKIRRKLWLSVMGIGTLAGFLFLFEPQWTPSGLLKNLNDAIFFDSDWPSIERYLLFLGLILGMFISAWRRGKFVLRKSNPKDWLLHLSAGTLMGIGASIALGGNDTQLLLALPTFSPAGLIAVLGMLIGIWLGLLLKKLFYFKN
ncbi:MAG: YeeE/YedE thiosulfate transporter family protein, partial [Psychromonas sp.]